MIKEIGSIVIGLSLFINGLSVSDTITNTNINIPNEIKIEQPEIFIPLITESQELWLKKLRNCESGNNPLARNDHDRDNLPAKGLYQFKDKTWRFYIKKYDLWNWQEWEGADFENAIWSREHQEVVLRYMLNDKNVNWRWEFPDCVKQYGFPPKS